MSALTLITSPFARLPFYQSQARICRSRFPLLYHGCILRSEFASKEILYSRVDLTRVGAMCLVSGKIRF